MVKLESENSTAARLYEANASEEKNYCRSCNVSPAIAIHPAKERKNAPLKKRTMEERL